MKAKPTVFAALHRPFRFRYSEGTDVLRDTVNRITGTRFTSTRSGVDLLRSIPAMRIAPHRFYMEARLHLGVDQPLKLWNVDAALRSQSKLMQDLLASEDTKLRRLAELRESRKKPAQPASEAKNGRMLTTMLIVFSVLFSIAIILLDSLNA